MLTLTGLRGYIRRFGSEQEGAAATSIKDNLYLKEELKYEALRILAAQLTARIEFRLVETLERHGYLVSEEEGGYTQILFDRGRLTCVNGDSFIQALNSLKHDYCDGFPDEVVASINLYNDSHREIGSAAYDQPKSTIARVRYRRVLVTHSFAGSPMILREQIPYKGGK